MMNLMLFILGVVVGVFFTVRWFNDDARQEWIESEYKALVQRKQSLIDWQMEEIKHLNSKLENK